MKIRRTLIISVGAILVIGVGWFSNVCLAQTPKGDPVDSARKDLQTLPTTEAAPSSERILGASDRFDLALPSTPGGATPRTTSPSAQTPTSQGWLLDALQKPGENERAENSSSAKGKVTARDEEKLRTIKETAGTWNPFLQQWLLPQNRNLASPGVEFGLPNREKIGADDLLQRNARLSTKLTAADKITGDATYHDPLAQRANPYLDDSGSTSSWPRGADFDRSRPSAHDQPSRPLSSSAQSSMPDPYSFTGDSKLTAARPSESALPPPNKPLVNEQKYFPQLDRF